MLSLMPKLVKKTWCRLNATWRWLGTALSFAVFGVGGVIFGGIVLPLYHVLPGDKAKKKYQSRKIIHYSFKFFIGLMKYIGVLSYEVIGIEKLNKPGQLVLANHPSLLDIVFLISLIRNADCVVKAKLLANPAMWGPIMGTGYIANSLPEGVIEQAGQSMAAGSSLIVFPEGTRTTPNEALSCQRGAANIAVRTRRNITAITIRCEPTTLTKADKWYNIPPRKMHFTIQVKDEIAIDQFLSKPSPSSAARQLTKYLQNYFTKELMNNV